MKGNRGFVLALVTPLLAGAVFLVALWIGGAEVAGDAALVAGIVAGGGQLTASARAIKDGMIAGKEA